MKVYYGLVHKDPESAYGITFPDLPGCFGAADEEEDVHGAAQAALTLYAQDEDALAEPRSIPELTADPAIARELASGAFLLAIPLIVVQHKARYNIMMDADLMAGVDRQAQSLGMSRSEYLSLSARDQLVSQTAAAVLQTGSRKLATGNKSVAVTVGKKNASAASKVLRSKTAAADARSVAASAMAQTKSKDVTGKAVASKAGRLLHDTKASPEAKSAAAALAQAPDTKGYGNEGRREKVARRRRA